MKFKKAIETNSQALLLQYSALASTDSTALTGRQDTFQVKDVTITLYFQPDLAPDQFQLRAEVLDLDDDGDQALLLQQLTENLGRYHANEPVFALAPDLKRMIALLNIPVTQADPDQLQTVVNSLVNDIRTIRAQRLNSLINGKPSPATSLNTITSNAQQVIFSSAGGHYVSR